MGFDRGIPPSDSHPARMETISITPRSFLVTPPGQPSGSSPSNGLPPGICSYKCQRLK